MGQYTNWGIVRLAARGEIHPHLQLVWMERHGIDPVRVSYSIWSEQRTRTIAISLGLTLAFVAVFMLIVGARNIVPTPKGLSESQVNVLAVMCLFIFALITVAYGALVPKFAYMLYKGPYVREFVSLYWRLSWTLNKKPAEISKLQLKQLREVASAVLGDLAYSVIRWSENDDNFETKCGSELAFRKAHRLFHDFDLVSGDFKPFFDRARQKRDEDNEAQRKIDAAVAAIDSTNAVRGEPLTETV